MGRALAGEMLAQPGFVGSAPESAFYGALELKQCYRRNLVFGALLAASLHVLAVGAILIWRAASEISVVLEPAIRVTDSLIVLHPPPPMTQAPPQANVRLPDESLSDIGIPTPVPDEEAPPEAQFLTRDQLALILSQDNSPIGETPGGYTLPSTAPSDSEYFPAPGEFVPVGSLPKQIDQLLPIYPEVACLTGTEGGVTIEALVDKNGKVREARVVKPSGSSVGFEEAALAVALKHVYKPALQNGRPIAVRITYRVEFRLKQR